MTRIMFVGLVMDSFLLVNCADAAENDNARAFSTICATINIAQSDIEEAENTPEIKLQDEMKTLKKINMSVSPDSFFNLDFGPKPPENGVSPDWAANHALWKELQEEVTKGTTEISGYKLTRAPASHARKVASQYLNATMKEAQAILQGYEKAATNEKTAKQLLNMALFGEGGVLDKTTEKTFGSTAAIACNPANPGSGVGSGMSLANDLACICDDRGKGLDCTGAGICTATIYNDVATAAASYENLVKRCPTIAHNKLTADGITAAVHAFLTNIKEARKSTQVGNVILGARDIATCDTGGTSGCVKYKQDTGTGELTISWLEKLKEAATGLRNENDRRNRNAQRYREIKALVASATRQYTAAQEGDRTPKASPAAAPSGKNKVPTETDCNKHQSSDKCGDP
uniref:Variant surface glycoprotein 1443 n=1 Tax=Trypanosoma brucei TaxID=5691 RepID=M4SWE8_9TRYP|nr:variant surface glycoprotein 1443 [Trypanosoma brucei]